ncbi:MAG: ribosome silencing factor [Candidatus Omnitrophota bacterium]
MRSRQKALCVAELANVKKAEGIVILDMRKLSNVTDFFIIMTSSSATRSQAIADNIKEGLFKAGEPISSIEGYNDTDWVLIDAHNVVVHIFNRTARLFYSLESLWADARRVKLCQKNQKATKKPLKKTLKRK